MSEISVSDLDSSEYGEYDISSDNGSNVDEICDNCREELEVNEKENNEQTNISELNIIIELKPENNKSLHDHDELKMKGWFLPDMKLKNNIFHNYGGYINCFKCCSKISYYEIYCARIFPYSLLGNKYKDLSNIFIICNKCEDNLPYAPKTINDIEHLLKKRQICLNFVDKQLSIENKLIKSMNEEYNSLQVKKHELVISINSLDKEIKNLERNHDIYKLRVDKLSEFKNKNNDLASGIINDTTKNFEKFNDVISSHGNMVLQNLDNLKKLFKTFDEYSKDNIKKINEMNEVEITENKPCQICSTYDVSYTSKNCGNCFCEKCSNELSKTRIIVPDDNEFDAGAFYELKNKCPFCQVELNGFNRIFL